MKKVIGFGHPLLDVCSHVDHEFLHRYYVEPGSCNLAQKNQLPLYEELSQRRDVDFVPGGAAMNTIRIVRWMARENVGSFVGALGDDEFGCILERALSKAGVKPFFQRVEDKPTGCCACLVVDKERSLVANIGAALQFSLDYLHSPAVTAAIDAADIFYCEGFFLNTASSPASSVEIGRHCAERNKLFCYNLSAPYLCHIFKERWSQVIPFIDIIFGSRIDAKAFAEAFEFDEKKDLKKITARISELPKINRQRPRLVVITGGSEATYITTETDKGIETIEFEPALIPPELIVDTNGAGDAFVGGFISQLLLNKPIEICVKAGHLAAADVIKHSGCSFSDIPPDVED